MGRPLVSRGKSNRLPMKGKNKSWILEELKHTTQLQRTEYSPCPPSGVASLNYTTGTKVGPRTITGYCGTLQDEVVTSKFHRTKVGTRTKWCRTNTDTPLYRRFSRLNSQLESLERSCRNKRSIDPFVLLAQRCGENGGILPSVAYAGGR